MPMPQSPVPRLSFRNAPLAAAACWFSLGLLLAHWQLAHFRFVPTVELLGALLLLSLLTGLALHKSLRLAWMPVAAIWVTLGLAALEWQPGPVSPGKLLSYADNLSRTVEGHVLQVHPAAEPTATTDADPVPPWDSTEEGPSSTAHPLALDLAVDAIEDLTPDRTAMVPASGGIRVTIYDAAALNLHCGERLELPLRLRTPDRYRDPGAFQYADQLLQHGISAEASTQAARITVTGRESPTLRCRIFAAQSWASTRLFAFVDSSANRRLPRALRLDPADAAMLNAMLFGDRTGLTHGLRLGFERTGSFHLFVVSGLHIALVAAGVFWLLMRMRSPRWVATLLTLLIAAAYTALTGFGQPAQRALVMTSVYLLARLLSRVGEPINALGAAVLVLLLWAPSSLFDASFQMTALAILAIAGIAAPLGRRLFRSAMTATREVFHPRPPMRSPQETHLRVLLEFWGESLASLLGPHARRAPATVLRLILWALELALIGVVAELVMVLPMSLYFHRATVFALPANMLVIPIVAVLAPAGLVTFLCSLISPWLAVVPAAVTGLMLHGVAWAIARISRLSAADVRVPGPAPWVAAAAILAWLACCWLVRRSRMGAIVAPIALPLIAFAVLAPEPQDRTPRTLEITALDVGQGDSLLAVSPAGQTMLIDAGGPTGRAGPAEVVSNFDVGEEVVSPYLWSRRICRLDVVVLSHAHTDHMGGMPAILENFHPRELWVGIDPHSTLYAKLMAEAARLHILVRHLHAGDTVQWGEIPISVLAPAPGYANPGPPRNDDSLVLDLQYGRSSALLEGDAETPSEEAMLAAHLVHPVTLLKVGHHGSRTSSTEPFLAAAQPADAIISVGRRNTFGHPRPEIVSRLAEHHARVFRTDSFGLTSFLLTQDGGIREVLDGTAMPPHVR